MPSQWRTACLISPWESPTYKWNAITFPSLGEGLAYIYNHDLTKEHYLCPIDILVKHLEKQFEDEKTVTLTVTVTKTEELQTEDDVLDAVTEALSEAFIPAYVEI